MIRNIYELAREAFAWVCFFLMLAVIALGAIAMLGMYSGTIR